VLATTGTINMGVEVLGPRRGLRLLRLNHDVQLHHPHPVSEGGGGATVGEPLCKRCHRQAHR
jgi:hypothetical protein